MRSSVFAVVLCACAAPRPATPPPRATAAPPVWPFSARAKPLESGRPMLLVDETSVTLDGVVVASTDAAPARIDGLWTALKQTRTHWIETHSGTPFPGEVQLRAKSATDVRVIRGVFLTSAMSGYPWVGVVVKTADGEGELRVGAPIPLPIDVAPPSRTQVQATRDTLVFTAFDQQTIVREVRAPASIVELPSAIAPEPSPSLLEPLRTVWSAGHHPFRLSLAEGQTHGTFVALVDAIAAVAPDALVTLD